MLEIFNILNFFVLILYLRAIIIYITKERVQRMKDLEIIKNKIKNEDLTEVQIFELLKDLDENEIKTLSNDLSYVVFLKKCLGDIYKKFIPIFGGAVVFIKNDKGQILLQRRSDNKLWGIPGGIQEVGESLEQNAVREVREESGLIIKEEDLVLLGVVSGESRRHDFGGDISYHNTAVFFTDKYIGEPRIDHESLELRFFDINDFPKDLYDGDLFEVLFANLDKI